MKKIGLFFLILFISLSSSLFASGGKEKQDKQERTISIGVLPDVDSIPFVIARMEGFFSEEGIRVDIKHFKSPVDRDTAFQAGDVDAVISDILAAAFAENGGFPVVITSMTNGSYKLLAAPGSGINSIGDLRGRSIGISKNTIIEYATDRMLEAGGLTGEEIEKVVIPQIPVRLEMLAAGKLNGATLAEPLSTSAVTSGCSIVNSTDKLGINPGIFLVNRKVFEGKRKTLEGMYRAYNKAVDYLKMHEKADYIDRLVETMGFPSQAKDVMVFPSYTKASPPPEKEFEQVMDWLTERNLIDGKIEYSRIVDTSLLPE